MKVHILGRIADSGMNQMCFCFFWPNWSWRNKSAMCIICEPYVVMSGTCQCCNSRVYLIYLTSSSHNPTVLVTRDTSTVNIHVRCSHPTYRTVYCPDRSACQQFPRSHIPSYGVYYGECHFLFLYFVKVCCRSICSCQRFYPLNVWGNV